MSFKINKGLTQQDMDVEEFVVAFTVAVTEVSDSAVDLIAKKGKHSIFAILQGIFPQASAMSTEIRPKIKKQYQAGSKKKYLASSVHLTSAHTLRAAGMFKKPFQFTISENSARRIKQAPRVSLRITNSADKEKKYPKVAKLC